MMRDNRITRLIEADAISIKKQPKNPIIAPAISDKNDFWKCERSIVETNVSLLRQCLLCIREKNIDINDRKIR